MEHILDNPVWNALISGNKSLAKGNECAKYFSEGISLFVGIKNSVSSGLDSLHDIMDFEHPVAVVSTEAIVVPRKWKMLRSLIVFQMLCNEPITTIAANNEFIPLHAQHIPEMLALTQLTNPGPFYQNTIRFGDYFGIFKDNKLVAMSGQRLYPHPYIEISAVCTHPDHLGHGYASQLIIHQISRIKAKSCIPFLHVLNENIAAITLYNKLGFFTRKEMTITVIQKISK